MKSITSVVAVIVLLTTGAIDAQSASSSKSSKNARENHTTAQLNRDQLTGNPQQAAAPSAGAPMANTQSGTVIKGKYVPPGARCGNDNPSCAQQIGNPAVNSPSQMRLQHAQ